jgi:hypothetical protein
LRSPSATNSPEAHPTAGRAPPSRACKAANRQAAGTDRSFTTRTRSADPLRQQSNVHQSQDDPSATSRTTRSAACGAETDQDPKRRHTTTRQPERTNSARGSFVPLAQLGAHQSGRELVDDKRGNASVLGSVITLDTSVGRPRPEHQPLLHRRRLGTLGRAAASGQERQPPIAFFKTARARPGAP